ncbi:hypothetical protein A2U01_0086678, partial [Trifolium medium]|nr:hypothetical protein [Trifolium medium]
MKHTVGEGEEGKGYVCGNRKWLEAQNAGCVDVRF